MKRKQHKPILAILVATCSLSTSIQGFAAPKAAPTTPSDKQQPQYVGFGGYLFPIDFNLFVSNLFKTLTNDTAAAADVNDLPIVSSYDDDPDGFNQILWLP